MYFRSDRASVHVEDGLRLQAGGREVCCEVAAGVEAEGLN